MFGAATYRGSSRQSHPAHSAQVDSAAGRVLWVRFNNPCRESSPEAAPAPAPGPISAGGRRLQQLTHPVAEEVNGRLQYVTDKAGYTAGGMGPSGELVILDNDRDMVTIADYKKHSFFTYNGVPWEPPQVTSLPHGGKFPLDGGVQVTVTGVGFARSPFTHCSLVHPDPAGRIPTDTYDLGTNPAVTSVIYRKGSARGLDVVDVGESQITFGPADTAPTDASDQDTRGGKIPKFKFERPFPGANPTTNIYNGTFAVGIYEELVCTSPESPFMGEGYEFGVSNDGGLSISPPLSTEVTEMSVKFDGSRFVTGSGTPSNLLTSGMTVSAWVYVTSAPTGSEATILELDPSGTKPFGFYFKGDGSLVCKDLSEEASIPMSLNMWHFLQISVGKVGLSPAQTQCKMDGQTFYGPSQLQSSAATLTRIGMNFVGYIDEVKMVDTQLLDMSKAFTREPAGAPGLVTYYRFNGDLKNSADGTDGNKGGDATCNGCTFVPTTAPWEASIVYTVDGKPLADSEVVMSMEGGTQISLTGYNFANSAFLECSVGERTEANTYKTTAFAPQDPVCVGYVAPSQPPVTGAIPVQGGRRLMADISQSGLGRFGTGAVKTVDYTRYGVSGGSGVITGASDTAMTCTVPAGTPGATFIGVGSSPTVTTIPAYYSESALECDGSGHVDLTAAGTALGAASSAFSEYGVSLWVYPYSDSSAPASAGPAPAGGRRLQSEDGKRFSGRRTLLQAGGESTVLAFEGAGGGHSALLMYDGNQFFYYDDNILDAFSHTVTAVPDEWHYVSLSVDADGHGTLSVDCQVAAEFTTVSRPTGAGTLTMCAETAAGGYSSHFSGLVDEVAFFKDAKPAQDQACRFGPATGAVAYYTMSKLTAGAVPDVSGTSPALDSATVAGGVRLTSSSAPWLPALTGPASPGEMSNRALKEISVTGSNFAPSPFFRVRFDKEVTTVTGETQLTPGAVVDLPNTSNRESQNSYVSKVTVDPPTGETITDEDGCEALYKIGIADDGTTFQRVSPDAEVTTVLQPLDIAPPTLGHHAFATGTREDRRGIRNAAAAMPVAIAPVDPTGAQDGTACAWLFFDHETEVFKTLLTGGYKFVCYVRKAGAETLYLNTAAITAEHAEYALYLDLMVKFLASGQLPAADAALAGFQGAVDEIFLYSTALPKCEILKRYYTDDFAYNMAAAPLLKKTVSTTFTNNDFPVEAWIHPLGTEGPLDIVATADGSFAFGLQDNALYLSVCSDLAAAGGCSFSGLRELTSWRSVVMPKTWSHVAATYDGEHAFFFVDGVLRDVHTFGPKVTQAVGTATVVFGEAYLTPLVTGLVHSVSVTKARDPYKTKASALCPEKAAMVTWDEHNTPMTHLVDTSNVDAADFRKTTVEGGEIAGVPSGATGKFTITARNSCGEKVKTGGDPITAVLSRAGVDDIPMTIVDTNDGNYHTSHDTAALQVQCGLYTTKIEPGGHAYATTIPHGVTSAATSTFTSPSGNVNCFGLLSTFTIQAKDANGCAVETGTDVFKVILSGPHDVSVFADYSGADGIYTATFSLEVAGSYSLAVSLESGASPREIVGSGEQCIEVCDGGAIQVDGTSITVPENSVHTGSGYTALDIAADGLTMEAWLKRGAAELEGNPYVFLKSATTEAGDYIKGYALHMDQAMTTVTAEVYAGLGDLRTVSGPLSPVSGWFHLAAIYSGTAFQIYQDNVLVAEATFPAPNKLHENAYLHPLEIGHNWKGMIDEVKLWRTARSPEAMVGSMYCPPYLAADLAHVAAYFSFNEMTGPAYGHSDLCNPFKGFGAGATVPAFSPAAFKNHLDANCLLADTSAAGVQYVTDTPLASTANGVGVASAVHSQPAFALATANGDPTVSALSTPSKVDYTVDARDECNYRYTKGDTGVFTSEISHVARRYFSDTDPAGTGYPEATTAAPLPPRGAEAAKGACVGGSGPGNTYSGSIYAEKHGRHEVALKVNGAPMYTGDVEVTAGMPAAIRTVVESLGPVEAGNMCHIEFTVRDFRPDENVLMTKQPAAATFSVLGAEVTVHYSVGFDPVSGVHVLHFIPPTPGKYSVSISSGGALTIVPVQVEVVEGVPRPILTAGRATPDAAIRLEHSAVVYGGDLYLWGGALTSTRKYLNDMMVLKGADSYSGGGGTLGYRKPVAVTGLPAGEDTVVKVVVDTAELQAANRMSPICGDVMFTLKDNGAKVPFYMDPHPGCGKAGTVFWVKVPAGAAQAGAAHLDMFYGGDATGLSDPKAVFALYDGFEGGAQADSIFTPAAACGAAGPSSAPFEQTTELAFSGTGALRASAGSAGALHAAPPGGPLAEYRLNAWFYDSNAAHAAHYLSPDFKCETGPSGEQKMVATAVGTYTLATVSDIAVASPWSKSGVKRTGGKWYQLTVLTAGGTTTVSVDGAAVKTLPAVPLEKVYLSAGYGVDAKPHGDLTGSIALWDEISVFPYAAGAAASAGAMAKDEKVVASVTAAAWEAVDTAPSRPPPPRYSHSTVVHGDAMYVFGGERSTHVYGDLWKFDFATRQWSELFPTGDKPQARYDHAAAVVGGKMILYGGHGKHHLVGGEPWEDETNQEGGRDYKGTICAYTFATNSWKCLGSKSAVKSMGWGRRGHTLVAVPATEEVLLFGGYTAAGFSSEAFKIKPVVHEVSGFEYVEVTAVATPSEMEPRYAHSSFSDGTSIFVFGGTNADEVGGLAELWKYHVGDKTWKKAPMSLKRFENGAGIIKGGFFTNGGTRPFDGVADKNTYLVYH